MANSSNISPEYLAESQILYGAAAPEYDRIYWNPSTGGFVLLHSAHNRQNLDSEMIVAKVLADRGQRVYLLPEMGLPQGIKTPDAEVNGELWDFKCLTTETTAFANRVQASIKVARRQGAVGVGYHIETDDYDLSEIRRGIRRAFDLDFDQQIQQVLLVFRAAPPIVYQRGNIQL
jgi:Contact-dependent growth inhibition CdiA C-terminal domain